MACCVRLQLMHIPYKGQGPAMADVIAGHVPIAFETTTVALPQIRTGKIRALATTGATKSENLPDLPTMNSLGFKDFDLTNWYGVFVPAGTPEHLVTQLNQAVREALQTPEVKKRLADMDSLKVEGTPQEFASFIKNEIPRWEELVKRSGATVE